jgi:hypothetical protein
MSASKRLITKCMGMLLTVAGAAFTLVAVLILRNAAVAAGLPLLADFATACVARSSVSW